MTRKSNTLTLVLLIWSTLAPRLDAENIPTTSVDIPVVVADFNNKIVKSLGPQDFSAQFGDTPVPVGEVFLDDGPKRIALILDASGSIPSDEWKLELESALVLLGQARLNDQFAFLVVGVEGNSTSFLSPGAVKDQLKGMEKSRPQPAGAGERIYDSIFEAANRCDPPQFGDTIFLVGHDQDSGSKASLDSIRDVIFNKHLRFLGLSFTDRLVGLPAGTDANKPLPKEFGPTGLELVTLKTGYYFSFHSVQSLRLPGQIPIFKEFLGDLYAWIAQPYRLRISSPASNKKYQLRVSVKDSERRRIHQNGIHSPQYLRLDPVLAD